MLTKDDLHAIRQIVKEEIKEETNPIKKELKKLRKDLNVAITSFDDDITETKLRVDRIEGNLHLTPFA